MSTVFISNLAIPLATRFVEGTVLDELQARFLSEIHIRRIKAKLRWLLQRGDINPDGLQAKAIELNVAELVPYATLDDEDSDSDPILIEAMTMARDMIVARMAQEGLPPPKGLDIHAKALVDALPDLQEKARLRVEARFRAASAAMGSAA